MTHWICPTCGEQVPAGWVVCTQCGYDPITRPVPEKIVDPVAAAYPPISCLRCNSTMRSMGQLRLHEGTRAWPFLFGDLGELLVNRESFETFICEACGKVEFFMPNARHNQP